MLHEAPGTIALPTAEIGRFTMFTICLSRTQQPEGCNLAVTASASVTENLNEAVRLMRPFDEWMWVLGDDHVWQSDCLMQMLRALDSNPEADVLVPLVSRRSPPWDVVIFHDAGMDPNGYPAYKPFSWKEIPTSGQFEVDAAGSAGMLIRREVLDAIGDPWFESSDGIVLNEDVIFCRKARAAGFQVWATADIVMGHLGIFNVRPAVRDGRWGALTEFTSPEEQFREVFMPVLDAQPEEVPLGGRR